MLLLLLLLLVGSSDAYLRTNVTLAIHHDQYISVHVGNPGRTLVLRLRWDMATSYIYSPPDTWSDTYSARDGGTELFYLGATKLRLPVVVGQREPDPRLDSSGSVAHDGSLALGRDSELWLRWRCFTLSRHALVLGPCEMAPRDVRYADPTAALTLHDEMSVSSSADPNRTWPLSIRLDQEFTHQPLREYTAGPFSLMLRPDRRRREAVSTPLLRIDALRIRTAQGGEERTVRICELMPHAAGRERSSYVIGRIHTTGEFVYSSDIVRRDVRVAPLFSTAPDVPTSMQAVFAVLTLLLWCVWTLERTSWLDHLTSRAIQLSSKKPLSKIACFDENVMHKLIHLNVDAEDRACGTLVWVARFVTIWSAYASAWGFEAARFAEWTVAGPKVLGAVGFYAVAALSVAAPIVVTPALARRKAFISTGLVQIALLAATYLQLLPQTTDDAINLAAELVLAAVMVVRAAEYPLWIALRGLDRNLVPVADRTEVNDELGIALLWCCLLLPFLATLFVYGAAAPLLEALFPANGANQLFAWLVLLPMTLYVAYARVMRSFTQHLQRRVLTMNRRVLEISKELHQQQRSTAAADGEPVLLPPPGDSS